MAGKAAQLSVQDRPFASELSISTKQQYSPRFQAIYWMKPQSHLFKLNTDGGFNDRLKQAGGGGILRDQAGELQFAFSLCYASSSSLESEMKALLHGMQICEDKGTAEAPWRQWDLMENLKHKMELLQAKVQHCFREANMVSDELATWGLKGCNQIYEKQDQLPRKVKGLLLLDTQALPTLRRTK
ncbi:hypothetical protein Droror1_Dr00018386 [Drosera rotundifolia]